MVFAPLSTTQASSIASYAQRIIASSHSDAEDESARRSSSMRRSRGCPRNWCWNPVALTTLILISTVEVEACKAKGDPCIRTEWIEVYGLSQGHVVPLACEASPFQVKRFRCSRFRYLS